MKKLSIFFFLFFSIQFIYSQELESYTDYETFEIKCDIKTTVSEAKSDCWNKLRQKEKAWTNTFLKNNNGYVVATNTFEPFIIEDSDSKQCRCKKEVYYFISSTKNKLNPNSNSTDEIVYQKIKETEWYKKFNAFFDDTFKLIDVNMKQGEIDLSTQKLSSIPVVINSDSKTYVNCTDKVTSQKYKRTYTKTDDREIKLNKSMVSLKTIEGSISVNGSKFNIKASGSVSKSSTYYYLKEVNRTINTDEVITVDETRNIDVKPQTIMEFNSIVVDETTSHFFKGSALIDGHVILVPKLDLSEVNLFNGTFRWRPLIKNVFSGKNPKPLKVDDKIIKQSWKQLTPYLYFANNFDKSIRPHDRPLPTNSDELKEYIRVLMNHPELSTLNPVINIPVPYKVFIFVIPLRDILSFGERRVPITGVYSHTIRKEKIKIDSYKCEQ